MGLFKKKVTVLPPPEIMTLQKIKATFKTIDGEEHINTNYKWIRSSGLLCFASTYVMIGIKDKGYITDNDDVMYPLTNVVSIKWDVVEERKFIKKCESHYQIYFSNKEVSELQEVENDNE